MIFKYSNTPRSAIKQDYLPSNFLYIRHDIKQNLKSKDNFDHIPD